MPEQTLSPADKIAVLLSNVPMETASEVLRYMDEKHIKEIVSSMYSLKNLPAEECKKIISEFHDKLTKKDDSLNIEKEKIKDLLERSVGEKKAINIINRVYKENPFNFLNSASMLSLFEIIKEEPAQIIALVVSNLNTEQAVELTGLFEEEKRKEIFKKMKSVRNMGDRTVMEISEYIKKSFQEVTAEVSDSSADKAAEIISFLPKEQMISAMENLKKEDPLFYEEVNRKLITFDKVVEMEDRQVQKVLRILDQRTMGYALKGAPQNISEKIYKNMTEEAAKSIMEDMETLPNLSEKAVEEARRKFAAAMKKVISESNNAQ